MTAALASRNHVVANPEGLSAGCVLEAFAAWLDQRLAEATRLEMDLAFRDRPFDVEIGRVPALVGWEHRYLAPGAEAPKGKMWTVYRLHDQTGRPSELATARASADKLEDLTPLLGELGYLGVFDGDAAMFPGVGKR
ncbi:hypothetical protein DMC25_21365 [Caulobacter sp. D4A]|uniref:hypothetical protein n=1 Tax=unclassified Caulobacter TaxID=2648921 RepID=UPI000D73B14F|nr:MULTISPECIES: hypothetical protein [unclassified Caulobacter]PXA80220.1 hypothetical protein DMC25_21365 [Caulobacter sp. D4A]PXA87610.1 hypothetical protein DMC18_20695 [Caulobacter sp. D5]